MDGNGESGRRVRSGGRVDGKGGEPMSGKRDDGARGGAGHTSLLRPDSRHLHENALTATSRALTVHSASRDECYDDVVAEHSVNSLHGFEE